MSSDVDISISQNKNTPVPFELHGFTNFVMENRSQVFVLVQTSPEKLLLNFSKKWSGN